jgi:hypothetical protein
VDTFVDLDVVGALQDSDKSSSIRFGWDYLRHYEMLLAEYRHLPINVLEIGVSRGGSLRSWAWFFTEATITGIDIDATCSRHEAGRVHVEIGSQIDPDFLDRVTDKAPPTVIIDDGSHNYEHIIFTFEHLLPKLKPGGLYIVEDIGFHFGPAVQAPRGKPNVPEYFLELARCCFAHGKLEPGWGLPPAIVDAVDRVTFIGQSVAIHKRDPERDVARGLATAEQYIATHDAQPGMDANMAEWLLLHEGPNDKAAAFVNAALASEPGSLKLKLMQAETLLRGGDLATAQEILARMAAKGIEAPRLQLYLATLLLRAGNHATAGQIRDAALGAKGMKLAKEKFHRLAKAQPEEPAPEPPARPKRRNAPASG